ncbi:MAG: sulfotransferase [Desulfobacteraceae bacterium]|nr:sulfotransferase [Desulfobacteraceae bacterium]
MPEQLSSKASRYIVPREIRSDGLVEAVRFLKSFERDSKDDNILCESPIFVLSAGWRSGSTLVQRLICSDNRILMWGEPFGDRIPICRLASVIENIKEGDAHLRYSIDKFAGDLSKSWVANLNPGVSSFLAAHRAYIENSFAYPALSEGFDRWGAKWVRLTAFHAEYLKWIYPEARFIFLVRHPLSAYRSYKVSRWYTVKPYYKVNNVFKFMAHWNYLGESFFNEKDRIGAMLIRYEDIHRETQLLEKLENYLGIQIRNDVLSHKVGARDKKGVRVYSWERYVCKLLTGSTSRKLGYEILQDE